MFYFVAAEGRRRSARQWPSARRRGGSSSVSCDTRSRGPLAARGWTQALTSLARTSGACQSAKSLRRDVLEHVREGRARRTRRLRASARPHPITRRRDSRGRSGRAARRACPRQRHLKSASELLTWSTSLKPICAVSRPSPSLATLAFASVTSKMRWSGFLVCLFLSGREVEHRQDRVSVSLVGVRDDSGHDFPPTRPSEKWDNVCEGIEGPAQ